MLAHAPLPSALPRGCDMAAALEHEGYLVLGGPDELLLQIDDLWRAGEAFFALPDKRKLRNTLAEYDGYHDIGKEYSDRPERPDLAESFWARLIHAGATPRFVDAEARRTHKAALDVCRGLEALLTPITEALARHYAERWSPALAFACDRASHLQFNRYQPQCHGRDLRGIQFAFQLCAILPAIGLLVAFLPELDDPTAQPMATPGSGGRP